MKIMEYDEVDPLQVLHLTMLALDFQFTPEYAAHIRRTDPRPLPCFTVNAVENDMVLGQVGVFRLPMISTEGREDVGGVWAVATHPQYSEQGIASQLLEHAHHRMRAEGLRFSTLGTNRFRVAYKFYQKHGYEDANIWATALARWESAHQPTRLRVQPLGSEEFDFVEQLFENVASDYLGFAWRHRPFTRLHDKVSPEDIWIVLENNIPVGYVFAHKNNGLLKLNIQVLRLGIDAVEVAAAVASQIKARYLQIVTSRPSDVSNFRRAGYYVAHPNWDAFMIKPLDPNVTVNDARQLFGIGTDRFLISWLDVT